jgi:hypothetical protein
MATVAVLACGAGAQYVYEQAQPGYIAGWVEGNSPSGHGTDYHTLEEAMAACDHFVVDEYDGCKISSANAATPGSGCVCHGVTFQPTGSVFQPRAAATITPDTVNKEKSWLRTDRRCPRPWGVSFLVVVICGVAIYAGGGRLYNRQRGRNEWPHAVQWNELRSLVLDGAIFMRSRAQGRTQRYNRVEDATGSRGVRPPKSKAKASIDGHGQARKQDSKKKKKKKKTTPTTMEEEGEERASLQGNVRIDAPQPTSTPTGSSTAREKAVASAGGGRWVHVPA